MPTLVQTIGSATANSYATTADADTYFDERLHPNATLWSSQTTDDKERALITATRRLDQEDWQGVRVDEAQALDWPRYWAYDEDGTEYDSDEIPTPVIYATYELALHLLVQKTAGKDALAETGLEEFRSAKVGPMDMERDQNFEAGQLPANVQRLLSAIVRGSGSGSVRLERA